MKLIKQSAMKPATVVIEEPTTDVSVLLMATAIASFGHPDIFMDSFLVPVFFMISIGMAIVYNLGSNILLGEVSYITKALAAVLQLGVTLDYSIFLWHSYKK